MEQVELCHLTTVRHRIVLSAVTILKYFVFAAIRRRRPGEIDDSPQKRQPVPQVHVDQTAASATARVHRHLPAEDAPELVKHRFQIINLWRPIHHAAWDWPLALCDYRSIDVKNDLVPVTLRYPDRDGETLGVKYNPNHKFKYLKGMEPGEFVLIKWYVVVDTVTYKVLIKFPSPVSTPKMTERPPFSHLIPRSTTRASLRVLPCGSQLSCDFSYSTTSDGFDKAESRSS